MAEKLCQIRHRLELTQEELKERLEQLGFVSDLDRADVSDFERGRRDPDLLTLLSYGCLANVYLDVLVGDELDLPEELPGRSKSAAHCSAHAMIHAKSAIFDEGKLVGIHSYGDVIGKSYQSLQIRQIRQPHHHI